MTAIAAGLVGRRSARLHLNLAHFLALLFTWSARSSDLVDLELRDDAAASAQGNTEGSEFERLSASQPTWQHSRSLRLPPAHQQHRDTGPDARIARASAQGGTEGSVFSVERLLFGLHQVSALSPRRRRIISEKGPKLRHGGEESTVTKPPGGGLPPDGELLPHLISEKPEPQAHDANELDVGPGTQNVTPSPNNGLQAIGMIGSRFLAHLCATLFLGVVACAIRQRDRLRTPRRPPEYLLCPITLELLIDPVVLVETGQTYERAMIKKWLRTHDSDPISNQQLKTKRIVPNVALRHTIEDWLHQNSVRAQERESTLSSEPRAENESTTAKNVRSDTCACAETS